MPHLQFIILKMSKNSQGFSLPKSIDFKIMESSETIQWKLIPVYDLQRVYLESIV